MHNPFKLKVHLARLYKDLPSAIKKLKEELRIKAQPSKHLQALAERRKIKRKKILNKSKPVKILNLINRQVAKRRRRDSIITNQIKNHLHHQRKIPNKMNRLNLKLLKQLKHKVNSMNKKADDHSTRRRISSKVIRKPSKENYNKNLLHRLKK